jgi:hypothetical protein
MYVPIWIFVFDTDQAQIYSESEFWFSLQLIHKRNIILEHSELKNLEFDTIHSIFEPSLIHAF